MDINENQIERVPIPFYPQKLFTSRHTWTYRANTVSCVAKLRPRSSDLFYAIPHEWFHNDDERTSDWGEGIWICLGLICTSYWPRPKCDLVRATSHNRIPEWFQIISLKIPHDDDKVWTRHGALNWGLRTYDRSHCWCQLRVRLNRIHGTDITWNPH